MKLYDLELSGNAYRIRLMLSLLGLKAELHSVNLMQGEQRQEWFLKLNPRGQVPVLDDDGTVIWDSLAILVYLARKYGGERWLPSEAKDLAEVMQWLALMENETLYGLGKARVIVKFKFPGSLEEAQTLGRRGLNVLEGRLSNHDWLALGSLHDRRRWLLSVCCPGAGRRDFPRPLSRRAQVGRTREEAAGLRVDARYLKPGFDIRVSTRGADRRDNAHRVQIKSCPNPPPSCSPTAPATPNGASRWKRSAMR
ncbi:MAG: glutathione S-transferase family protein [Comamonadaceae bacterium]|nr:glutathione S-transferase family protein [Comamonadaceae bacterium]